MLPFFDHGVDQGITCIFFLAESIYGYVSEERWFASVFAGTNIFGAVVVAFSNVTPIIDLTISAVGISSVVTKSILQGLQGANATIDGRVALIFLAGIFVVITEIVVPHVANQVTLIVIEYYLYWVVLYFALY